ncbi:MAG: peptidoglycan-binding protein [Myxococcales bacterium]
MTAYPNAVASNAASFQGPRTMPVLRMGAQGAAVKLLQERLKAAQIDPGPANGYFGAQTHLAVLRFQQGRQLEKTGIANAKTWEALLEEESRPACDAGELPTLRLCSQGPAVTQLQQRLQAAGFNPGSVDGYFGAQTRWSVQAFQRAQGLATDGVVTLETWKRLAGVVAAPGGKGKKTAGSSPSISAQGQAQLQRLVAYARANRSGRVGGRSLQFVWRYLTASGYGKLSSPADLPAFAGDQPRDLADFLNASPAHLREAGLQRLDTAISPRISNPHDPRIPAGAVIVVAGHPFAGEIFVKGATPGEFLNDGDFSGWIGDLKTWCGRVLGVYVPE